ncbi:MAG: hypothetical protein PHO75_00755 [Candidatus Shapirobacteria bacterium]|nr:hypothetical protein [Candidatus Shapirobacteria bacterium]
MELISFSIFSIGNWKLEVGNLIPHPNSPIILPKSSIIFLLTLINSKTACNSSMVPTASSNGLSLSTIFPKK